MGAQHAEKNESASELAQVPELLQDMRHLQLDLEYHQQKLDQVLEENRQLQAENKQHKEQELLLLQQQQRAAKLRDRLEKLMKVVEHQRDAVRQLEGRALSAEAQANDRSSKLKIASNQVSRLQQLLGTNPNKVVPADRGQAF